MQKRANRRESWVWIHCKHFVNCKFVSKRSFKREGEVDGAWTAVWVITITSWRAGIEGRHDDKDGRFRARPLEFRPLCLLF